MRALGPCSGESSEGWVSGGELSGDRSFQPLNTSKSWGEGQLGWDHVGATPSGGGVAYDIWLVNQVRKWGMPNAFGAKIQLASCWNFQLLECLATSASDREVVLFLRYGWPLNYTQPSASQPPLTFGNHRGALMYKQQIREYIHKELAYGALSGPYCSLPWSDRVAVSPMTTRPKKDSPKRRVITDLSWPIGGGVNEGIPKDTYLSKVTKLLYPSVDTICLRAFQLGKGKAWGWKRDMSRAFRWVNLCPNDWPLMGTYWEGAIYFDKVAVMGGRSCPYIMQRVSSLCRHFMANMGLVVFNYVDDFIGVELESRVWQAFNTMGHLLRDLGPAEALDKAVSPTQVIVCLGTGFDLVDMIMFVPQDKITDIKQELSVWFAKSWYTRHQLECLIGKLQYLSACVRPGRVFIARLLNQLRKSQKYDHLQMLPELLKDLQWWWKFLGVFNGTSIMWLHSDSQVNSWFGSDASLSGIGAWIKVPGVVAGCCMRQELPQWLQDMHWSIARLEYLALVAALDLWGEALSGKYVKMFCDNEAVVHIVNNGSAKDGIMQSLSRKLSFIQARFDFKLKLVHLSSTENLWADLLSRSHMSVASKRKCDMMIQEQGFREESLPYECLVIQEHW